MTEREGGEGDGTGLGTDLRRGSVCWCASAFPMRMVTKVWASGMGGEAAEEAVIRASQAPG